jgi:hypothetical protein
LNKKREALRRGLRSFIEDTSRELADLEGRDLHASPPPEKPDDRKKTDGAISRPVADSNAVPRRPPPAPAVTAGAPHDVTVVGAPGAPATAMPDPPATTAQGAPAADAPGIAEPPPRPSLASVEIAASAPPAPVAVVVQDEALRPVAPEPLVTEIAERTPVGDAAASLHTDGVAPKAPPPELAHPTSTKAQPETADIHDGRVPRPEHRPTKSPRRAQGPARKRPRSRAVTNIGSNGVSADQAHARKGVCFAYFLNHECWRIPDAYCLTALHVCITRECPVYHLHKETLERRFAKKFKHFW